MKKKGVKYVTLVLVAFLFLLVGRSFAFGWYSCQQRDPSRPLCNPGSKRILYQTCDNYQCNFGGFSDYTCEYSGDYSRQCQGGIDVDNAVEGGCGGEHSAYPCYTKTEEVCDTCYHFCDIGSDGEGTCRSGSRKGGICFHDSECGSYDCKCRDETTKVNKVSGNTISRGCCVSGSIPDDPVDPNCEPCNNCTPPECGEGYTETNTGCSAIARSCDKYDNCTNHCGEAVRLCYPVETNTNPSNLSTIRIDIDYLEGANLSQNPLIPTLIKLPVNSTSSPTSIIANLVSKPTGARDYGYRFFVNLADQLSDRLAVTSDNKPEDHPINAVSGLPNSSIFTENSTGFVAANVYSRNKCDDGTRESNILRGYYRVNTLPEITSLTIAGRPGDDETSAGCTAAARYTGVEANNPLIVTIKGTDVQGNDTINGAFLWLLKGNQDMTPYFGKTYALGPGATKTNPDRIGLFFAVDKAGNRTGVYKANNAGGTLVNWGRDTHNGEKDGIPSTKVQDANGKTLIEKIQILSYGIDPTDGTYTFEIELTFPDPKTQNVAPIVGKYEFQAMMTDDLSYYRRGSAYGGGTYVDFHKLYHQSGWYWNFDFVKPHIANYEAKFDELDQRVIKVKWTSSDYGSSVKDTVVNVEKAGIDNKSGNYQVKRVLPSLPEGNTVTLQELTEDNIGKIPVISGWEYLNSSLGETHINIMNNGESRLNFLVTVYDQACNRHKVGDPVDPSTPGCSTPPSCPPNPSYCCPETPPDGFDLNKWIATKGGIFYSKDRVTYAPKLLDPNIENYNTGSELITTGSNQPVGALDFGKILNPTIVNQVKDTNETRKRMLFNLLLGKIKAIGDGKRIINNLGECGHNEICYMGSIDPDGNIGSDIVTIGTDNKVTRYSGKILVVTDGDIDVYPDVVARDSGLDSLVLFAGGNINVKGSNRSSAGSLVYDQLDMLMIARNRIYIPKDARTDDLQQDGLKVFGSVIGLGVDDSNPAVLMECNLGFLNPTHPVLIVNYHPKYTSISEIFFGTDTSTYKQEVGFKL